MKKQKNKYVKQIHTLIKINNTHIQKEENEIAKLNGKKNRLLNELDEKDKEITKIVNERNHFKANYFKTLPSKTFATEQVNFFRNTLEIYESKVLDARRAKEKVEKEIESVTAEILTHRNLLKKYSFKNEKYDVLKVSYG